MSAYYFAYGSNMNPARMQARGLVYDRALAGRLPGYALRFNKQSHSRPTVAYANIVPASGRCVEGVLYQLAEDRALAAMDVFEGTPVRYSRERMVLLSDEGPVAAWVYVANPAFINNSLLPESNYLNHLLAGEAHLSADYLAWLCEHPAHRSAEPASEEGLRFNV